MKTTKFSSIAIAMLMTTLCLFLTVNTNVFAYASSSVINDMIKSDPRNVIQFMTSIVVVQQSPELLQVTVVRRSDEATVYQTNSSSAEIYISTQGWTSDDYIVHTINANNDYQTFDFAIE